MEPAGRSSFHKVGPNDSTSNHELGRGQIKKAEKSQTLENRACLWLNGSGAPRACQAVFGGGPVL